jgi:WD40 repeat protein
VLGADIQSSGDRIVSCGMDHSLKVWKLKKPELEKAILLSYSNQKSSRLVLVSIRSYSDICL